MSPRDTAGSRETWRMRGVTLSLVLIAPAGFAAGGPSDKTPPAITRHNLTFGGFVTQMYSEFELDGQPALETQPDAAAGSLGLSLGFHERLVPLFSIGARASLVPVPVDHRSDRYLLGFGVEPRLWPLRFGRADWYAAVPLGLSWVAVSEQPNRAFSRDISNRGSYFAGLTLGIEVTIKKPAHRLYAELGYSVHRTALDARIIPRVPELPSTVERWRYTDHVLRVEVGGSFGFGPL